ncbi:hypothetical protein BH23GEM9_BH23GEM9_15270 [soil metagenome]
MTRTREGFTIVEVLVAVILLAIILLMLGGLTFSTARHAVVNSDASTRQAISLELVNQLNALPYNQLMVGTSCDTVGPTRNRYSRCATVTAAGAGRDVVITTTPLQRQAPVSTVSFVRASPVPPQNPLCTLGDC